MKFTQDLAGTEAIRRKLEQIGDKLARRALAETAEEIEENVGEWAGRHTRPGGTGALFRSIVARPLGDGSQWEIGHDLQVAPHALFVHWGTKPHKIKPKNKKMLRFPVGGKFAFAREVNHPGYKGDPWLADQAAEAPKIFERRVNALLATL
ncbi:MAG: hypothetical protein RJA63_76 [Pseudomonadota bacterium]|jgi:hypothetical protein